MKKSFDTWNSGDPYEYFMGRWSKLMAPVFLNWLNLPDNMDWLDIGCGTGALSEAISANANPTTYVVLTRLSNFLKKQKEKILLRLNFLWEMHLKYH